MTQPSLSPSDPCRPARIEPLGDHALLIRLGEHIDPDLNQRVHALAARLRAQAPHWLVDIVPAYASIALFIDPDATGGPDQPGADREPPVRRAEHWLHRSGLLESASEATDGPPIDAIETTEPLAIPVCYGGQHGPDLAAVADHAGLTSDQVIALHLAGDYRVGMIGFAPGFPYLLGLDPALACPRLATPRSRVPAGSVGIGGQQTGIYPRAGAGGWNLIGRSPLTVFNPSREPPSRVLPGQRLRFVAITPEQFDACARRN
ncbi:MAG TPA: allophanate hydrolase [Xanthomonadales bacterium]|nr:allophanate hydrolase [Xanthomonadales bacterium]